MNHKTSRIELARTLYEWSTNSKTTFNDESPELLEKIKKLGIPYPNPDLAFFTTIYCELGTYNRNGAMLPKEVAENGLDTIKFKQINFEHEGAGHICGFILDARIADNFIVIDGVLFKSVWKEEFDQVKKYFEQGNLCVSFELWNSENGVSFLKILADGKKIVQKLIAHGCGLLMKEKPACQKARVFKLLAKEELVLASEQINETVSTTDDKLSYAELSTTEECKNCGKCLNERRTILMSEEIQVSEETKSLEVAESKIEETKTEEIIIAEVKAEEKKEEAVVETKTEEVVEESKQTEVKEEAAQVQETPPSVSDRTVTTTQELVVTDTIKEGAQTVSTEIKEEKVIEDETGKSTQTKEVTEVVTYTQEQYEVLRADYDAKLVAKDNEIEQLKQELGKKDQEIAEMKIVKAKVETKEGKLSLTVGSVDSTSDDALFEIRRKVDDKAFGRNSLGAK